MKTATALDVVFSRLMPLLGRVAVMLAVRRLNRKVVTDLILIMRESADRLESAYWSDYGSGN